MKGCKNDWRQVVRKIFFNICKWVTEAWERRRGQHNYLLIVEEMGGD